VWPNGHHPLISDNSTHTHLPRTAQPAVGCIWYDLPSNTPPQYCTACRWLHSRWYDLPSNTPPQYCTAYRWLHSRWYDLPSNTPPQYCTAAIGCTLSRWYDLAPTHLCTACRWLHSLSTHLPVLPTIGCNHSRWYDLPPTHPPALHSLPLAALIPDGMTYHQHAPHWYGNPPPPDGVTYHPHAARRYGITSCGRSDGGPTIHRYNLTS
jgi:hypothetical protein